VTKIRIVLANRPRMMRELVSEMINLNRQNDMEVVEVVEVEEVPKLLEAVRKNEADAVIVAFEDSEEPGLCSRLLNEFPNLTILGLTFQDKPAFIEQLCPRRREFIDPSKASIFDALRQAVRSPCSWAGDSPDRQFGL